MAEVRVHRRTDDLAVDLLEFLCRVAEGDDLSGTHEGKVQRVEEENDILPCSKKVTLNHGGPRDFLHWLKCENKRSYLDNQTTSHL